MNKKFLLLTAACLFFSQANSSDQKEDIHKLFFPSASGIASNSQNIQTEFADEETLKIKLDQANRDLAITSSRLEKRSSFDSKESLEHRLQRERNQVLYWEKRLEALNSQKVEYIKYCPQEMLTEILYWLAAKDAFNFARTSKYYFELICNDETSIYTKTSLENLLTLDQDQFISVSPSPFNHINIFIGQITNSEEKTFPYLSNFKKSLPNLKELRFQDELMTSLKLSNKNLGNLKIIDKIVWPQNLETLELRNNNLGALGESFANIKWPKKLRTLGLDNNDLGNLGINLSKLASLSNLEDLYLSGNNLGALGKRFSDIIWPPSIIDLWLGDNNLGDLKKEVLLETNFPENLEILILDNNNLGVNLLNIKLPSKIRQLFLEQNNLGALGLELLNIEWPRDLAEIHLENNNLRALNLNFSEVNKSKWPKDLYELNLRGNNLGEESFKKVKLGRLEVLF